MDLLGDDPVLSLNDDAWRIYSRPTASAPQHIGADAKVQNSVITEGSEILGTVRNSVLGAGVYVGAGAVVEDSVIMSGTVIKDGARVSYSILDENVTVGRGAVVGKSRADAKDITVIGAGHEVADLSIVQDGEMIS
jgi:glucose-1-phosphate adenylyltransferase